MRLYTGMNVVLEGWMRVYTWMNVVSRRLDESVYLDECSI